MLSLNAENFNNDQEALTFASRSRSRLANLTFTQPFSTGTLLTATAGHERAIIDGRGLLQFGKHVLPNPSGGIASAMQPL